VQATLLKLSGDTADAAKIRQAAAIVRDGGLVAFPTETVYGLAANAQDPAAMSRLRQVKQRPPDKPFAIHLADPADVGKHVPHLPLVAQKLVDAFMPGPITLVLPDGRGTFIGLRVPAHNVAQQFLRQAGVAVVAPSANRAGQPPPGSAQQVAQELGSSIDAILDGGPATIGESSTVVRVGKGPIEVLRPGLIGEADVLKAATVEVLLVCTGNSCRSPMAEALLQKRLADAHGVPPERLPDCGYRVVSAGTASGWGGGASPDAVAAVAEMNAQLCRSRLRNEPLAPGHIAVDGSGAGGQDRDAGP